MHDVVFHPFGCVMFTAMLAHVITVVVVLIISSRVRPRAPRAASLLASAAIMELAWRVVFCVYKAAPTRIYDAGLEVLLDVIAVLDVVERAAVLLLVGLAIRSLTRRAEPREGAALDG